MFEDQFDSLSDNWGVYDGVGNGGVGFRKPDHVAVLGGLLQITGTKADLTGGGLSSHQSQIHGRFEFRARVDAGVGWGPALMLWPDSEKWPDDGEVDVMESPSGTHDYVVSTLHWGADNSQESAKTLVDATQWHTYAVEWLPRSITFFVDGDNVGTFTEGVPSKPMHIAMQLDVGAAGEWIPAPDASTPDAVNLQIDWVRTYQLGG